MTPYENYLLNDFKPYTMQDNPFTIGNGRTDVAPSWDLSKARQGELSNKRVYNARGQSAGSTLYDDMFDIKNGRVGNYTDESKPMSNHPWVDSYVDYSMPGALPSLQPTDYSSAPVVSEVSPIEEYLENNPYLTQRREDFRDRAISRKKNVGEGVGLSIPEDGLSNANYGYEMDMFTDPDYAQYLTNMEYMNMLKSRIDELSTDGSYFDPGIREDMKAIKGNAMHWGGDMTPRYESEYDAALPTEDGWGLEVNPGRLSPKTAELIAKGTTQDRPLPRNIWGEESELNQLINAYREKLGLTNHVPSGGAYMQGFY